ncbi:hypothetical protein BDF22DRAFT_686040 [Syncephalis plumigaleata]|nr:hypothetical protein BDF22DRAFT_686040 [Syncephalis plumigaleata]
MASLQAFNAGLLGALAVPSTFTSAMQPTTLLNAQLAATSSNNTPTPTPVQQLPVVNMPLTVNATPSLPIPSVGSPVAPTTDAERPQTVSTRPTAVPAKRRSPSPIRPALPAKRISLSPSPPASSPVMSKSIISPDEDKRRRNTAASARFRLKKKQREQQLEKTAHCMTERVQVLEDRLRELEQENRWLRSLVIEKDPMLLGEGDGKRARLVEVDAQASAGGGVNAANTKESVLKA